MYVDNNLLLSGSVGAAGAITGQTVTGNGVSVLSTNTIDLLQARDIGEGADLFGRFECVTAAAGGTSVEMQVIAADDAALTTNVTVIGTTGAIPIASILVNSRFACAINPRLASKGQRYIGLRYVLVGNVTGGAYMGDVGMEIQDGAKYYPVGFSIL